MHQPDRARKPRLALIAALVAITVGAVVFIATRPSTTATSEAGASLGSGDPEAALWRRLQTLSSWLPTFEEALKDPEPEPDTVLSAFASVADKLASERGFWRDQVPNELLRCERDPAQRACKKLDESLPAITEGEALARQIRRLDASRAGVFLSRNAETLLAWLH
ncbi:MAG TPA: hypothetical protein PK095_19005, partial [Myxococcota bacterium]|nr:hypothetical protein [Myxococcota bacterium]